MHKNNTTTAIMAWKQILIATLVALIGMSLLPAPGNALGTEGPVTFLEMTIKETKVITDGTGGGSLPVAPITIANTKGEDIPMVPVRPVAESLGYTVEWEPEQRLTMVVGYHHTICLDVSGRVTVDGETRTDTETPCQIIDGCLMVAASFFQEFCGCNVIWDDVNQKVTIAAMLPAARQIGLDQMNSYLVETGRSDNGMIVAVIDTGIDCDHPYLRNRIVLPDDFTAIHDSGTDEAGHGTHVAGIIANCTPESVKIMPLKVSVENKEAGSKIAEAIYYAVEKGAKVINISLVASSERSKEITNAVNHAFNAGCVVVAAAGNHKAETKNYSPADAKNAIVVTAVDGFNKVLSDSNYGDTVTVAAPGMEIVSTISGGGYDKKTGSSMAAPFVTAAIAMLQMDISDIQPAEIKNILEHYSLGRKAAESDTRYGCGVISLNQYVEDSRTGHIQDFAKNRQEKAVDLDQEIEKIRQRVMQERPGDYAFIQPFFLAELINKAKSLYERQDYFAAGYLTEAAVAAGDTARCEGKNNLGFMLRRGEYVSYQYNARALLSAAIAGGQPMAYVNMALLEASHHSWKKADDLMRVCCSNCSELEMREIEQTWLDLANKGDAEGYIIQAWLMRFHRHSGTVNSQRECLDLAARRYADIPAWLYAECEQ